MPFCIRHIGFGKGCEFRQEATAVIEQLEAVCFQLHALGCRWLLVDSIDGRYDLIVDPSLAAFTEWLVCLGEYFKFNSVNFDIDCAAQFASFAQCQSFEGLKFRAYGMKRPQLHLYPGLARSHKLQFPMECFHGVNHRILNCPRSPQFTHSRPDMRNAIRLLERNQPLKLVDSDIDENFRALVLLLCFCCRGGDETLRCLERSFIARRNNHGRPKEIQRILKSLGF
ncbi:MAG: hypothetical protein BroJett014_21360 [Planctomycetota bacterium]|nr:MAG: hypothetical protein BroJett014_21360 [Planctomycetota bacterium]